MSRTQQATEMTKIRLEVTQMFYSAHIITIHTHNTSTYHDGTRYTEWVTLWSGESYRGWWSWKWSYTVTHTSVCTWSCSQDSSWVGRERSEYFHSAQHKTSNKLFPWA